jgi:hypothetical protein
MGHNEILGSNEAGINITAFWDVELWSLVEVI